MTDAPSIHPFLQDTRLRKLERLRKRDQFLRTQRRGQRASCAQFVVYVHANGLGYNRLGLTTSRKVGNAVRRNRWRRLLREVFRLHKEHLPQGYDLVVIVKPEQIPPSYDVLVDALIDRVKHGASRITRSDL